MSAQERQRIVIDAMDGVATDCSPYIGRIAGRYHDAFCRWLWSIPQTVVIGIAVSLVPAVFPGPIGAHLEEMNWRLSADMCSRSGIVLMAVCVKLAYNIL